MFWKKKDECVIKTTITKSSSQATYEKSIIEEAKRQAKICPECGYVEESNKPSRPMFGYKYGDGNNGFTGECNKCGAKWNVNYKLRR